MAKKFMLSVVVGSLVVFLVSSIWHLASGLGQVGIQKLPNEDRLLSAMRDAMHSSGLYLFPSEDRDAAGRNQPGAQATYLEKYKKGPTGILVYHRGGEALAFGRLLSVQFLVGLAGAMLIALVLAMTADVTTLGQRAITVVAIAVFAAVIYETPYWNWYGFPANYIIAHAAGSVVSWSAAGFVIAAMLRGNRTSKVA